MGVNSSFLKIYFVRKFVVLFCLLTFNFQLFGQTAREVGVEIRAQLNAGKYMQLTWLNQSGTTRYQVYTKNSSGNGWDRIADLQPSDTLYIDSTYQIGAKKEYRVARTSSNYTGFDGNGYILAGFEVPAEDSLGRVLVLIEDTYKSVASELVNNYLNQIINEGYSIDTHYVNRNDSVQTVKNWIYQNWIIDTNTFTTVLLLGRIPVPYSGNFRPDGHTDHTGAWPADLYYGSFDISWTDNSVNNTSASRTANHNVPNDNKFDLSRYNSSSQTNIQKVNIPVGRVDMTNMNSFGDDTALIKRYLIKALEFRTGLRKARLKTLVDDNFGYFGSEAFASGGFRNGSTFSKWDISTLDYRTEMANGSYLLSYGCGGGTYTSCSGVSSSGNFVSDSLLNPFTMLFGSYFGDWDNSNNFLRAPLASKGWGLVSVWAGRPYWMMHPCALGSPIANATIATQNTWKIYNAAAYQANVHVALMGDPSLRMFVVDNINSLDISELCDASINLSWGDVEDIADSIIIEKWNGSNWAYCKGVGSSNSNTVLNLGSGDHLLSLRFLKLMESGSGTWWQFGARRIENIVLDTVRSFYRFVPANNDFFSNNLNWECSKVPSATDSAIIISGTMTVNQATTLDAIKVNNGSTVKLTAPLTVRNLHLNNGTIDLNGQRLTITGGIYQSTDSTNYYIQAGTSASPKPKSELVFAPTANTSSTLYFNPNANTLKVLELGTSSKTAQVTLGNSINIKGGKKPSNVGSLKVNNGSKLIIPNGTSLTLQSDTFNAFLDLAAPAKRAIHCSGSGTFNVLALGLKYKVDDVLAVGANTSSEFGFGEAEVPV